MSHFIRLDDKPDYLFHKISDKLVIILDLSNLDLLELIMRKKLKGSAKNAAQLMRALSHPERLFILCQLTEGEKMVGDLWETSQLSQSAFSQHLSLLRKQKLVKTRKESQRIFYSIADKAAIEVLKVLYKFYCK